MYSLCVGVRKVFAIGRNRPARHRVLGGIDGELPKPRIGRSLRRRPHIKPEKNRPQYDSHSANDNDEGVLERRRGVRWLGRYSTRRVGTAEGPGCFKRPSRRGWFGDA